MTSNGLTRALAVTAARYWADHLRRIMEHPGTGIDPEILKTVRFGPPDAINLIPILDRLEYIERGKLTDERIRVFEAELTAILEAEIANTTGAFVIRNGYQPDRLINEAARRSELSNTVDGSTGTLFPIGSAMHIFLVKGGPFEPGVYADTNEPLPLISE